MDLDALLDHVTNGTQATDTLSNAVKTPDLHHLKAASIVVLFMLCRDFSKFVIPLLVKRLTESLVPTSPKKAD
jgi:hypothetical protein